MSKIVLVGAGSNFTLPLCVDLLQIEGLEQGVIGLVDVDPKRLDLADRVVRRAVEAMRRPGWRVESSTDRRRIFRGADYIIIVVEVAGLDCMGFENDIPLKYGIDQCVADTIGPGGLLHALIGAIRVKAQYREE